MRFGLRGPMKQRKANRIIVFLFTLANVQTTGAISAQSHTLSEVYQTGEIHLVPEVRITDESMEGKAFFSGGATDLSLDNGGNIYICSPRAGVLIEFGPEGSFKRTIGRAGQGPGEFGLPVEAVWSRGLLYIRDLATQRTSLMSDDGKFLKSIDWTGIQWRKIRALPDGRIIAQRERLDFIDPNSGLNLTLDLFSPGLEYIRTIYRRTLRRNRYIEKPRFVNIPIPFSPEVFWEITPGGKLIIGYSGDSAIDIYDPEIGPVCSFSLPFFTIQSNSGR